MQKDEKVELYRRIVSAAGLELKGKNNLYTSCNGHMFSFFGKPNIVAFRFGADYEKQLAEEYKTPHPVIQYNSRMHGYVELPDTVLKDVETASKLLLKSLEYVKSLPKK